MSEGPAGGRSLATLPSYAHSYCFTLGQSPISGLVYFHVEAQV